MAKQPEPQEPLEDGAATPQQQFMDDAKALAYRGRALGINLAEVIPEIVKSLEE